MKRFYAAAAAMVLLATALSCSRETPEDISVAYNRQLASWVKLNYGKQIAPDDSGAFILEMVPGTGKPVDSSSFVYAHYVCRDLSGNILSTNYEDLCRQTGRYSATDYYGSDIWQMGMNAVPTCLERALRQLRAGGKVKIALPVGQTAPRVSGYNAFSTSYSFNVVYDIEVDEVEQDVDVRQDELLKEFSRNNFGGADTTASGFYFVPRSSTPGCDSIPNEREIKVWYIGRLLNGKVFDTNIQDTAKLHRVYNPAGSYEALTITFYKDLSEFLNQSSYVQGFTYALSKMKFGDTADTFFRSDYGYGAGGNGTSIPEYSPLRFTLYIQPSDN